MSNYWRTNKTELIDSIKTLQTNAYFFISVDLKEWWTVAKIQYNGNVPIILYTKCDNSTLITSIDIEESVNEFISIYNKDTFYLDVDVRKIGQKCKSKHLN